MRAGRVSPRHAHTVRPDSSEQKASGALAREEVPTAMLNFERILCPVNLSMRDRRCLELSSALASPFQAHLQALHAQEKPDRYVEPLNEPLCELGEGEARTRSDLVVVTRQAKGVEQSYCRVEKAV